MEDNFPSAFYTGVSKLWFDRQELTTEEDAIVNEVATTYYPDVDLKTARKQRMRQDYTRYANRDKKQNNKE